MFHDVSPFVYPCDFLVFSCKHREPISFQSWCRGAGGDGPHHDALSEPHYRLFVVWNGILERSGAGGGGGRQLKPWLCAIPGTSPRTNSKKMGTYIYIYIYICMMN